MYLSGELIRQAEERLGTPLLGEAEAEFSAREFALLDRCAAKGRAHDITLFIFNSAGELALIRKPTYPPGVFRPPSGGAERGESFAQGAIREALEETGLDIRLERYLLRVSARFTCDDRTVTWTTHVVSATQVGGVLEPRDRKEIAEACWGTPRQLSTQQRDAMLRLGSAGMRYRVDLHDAALHLLGFPLMADHPFQVSRFSQFIGPLGPVGAVPLG
jgi:8-oxo-dGTP pyrophosphatase MutT (NUDIX family)